MVKITNNLSTTYKILRECPVTMGATYITEGNTLLILGPSGLCASFLCGSATPGIGYLAEWYQHKVRPVEVNIEVVG